MECFSIQRLFLALIIVYFCTLIKMINPDIVYFLFIYKVFFFKLVTPDVSLHPSGERKDNPLQ